MKKRTIALALVIAGPLSLATFKLIPQETHVPFGGMPTSFYADGAPYIQTNFGDEKWRDLITRGRIPYHLLTAADFRLDDSVRSDSNVFTRGFIAFDAKSQVRQINHDHWVAFLTSFGVYSGLDRPLTWRRSTMTNPTAFLQHEQGHLDLTELASRTFAGQVAKEKPEGAGTTRAEALSDLETKVKNIYAAIQRNGEAEQIAYDQQTNSGWNQAEQNRATNAMHAKLMVAGIRPIWADQPGFESNSTAFVQ